MAAGSEILDADTLFDEFGLELVNYLWTKIGYSKSKVRTAIPIKEIGDAVMCMIVITRKCLYDVLYNIHIRTVEDAVNVTRKLCRIRRQYREAHSQDEVQLFFELCAIIAEVHLYCVCAREYPFEEIAIESWNTIMKRGYLQKVLTTDGWFAMTAHARLYKGTAALLYNRFYPFEHPYMEFTAIPYLGLQFQTIQDSYTITYEHLPRTVSAWEDGAKNFKEQLKIKDRITRLEEKAARARESLASNISQIESQIATQVRKLKRLGDATEWTRNKLFENMRPVTPYLSSDEEYWTTETSENMPPAEIPGHVQTAASASRKKKKNKKKKKAAGQESGQEPSHPPTDQKTVDDSISTQQGSKSTDRPLLIPGQSSTSPSEGPATSPPIRPTASPPSGGPAATAPSGGSAASPPPGDPAASQSGGAASSPPGDPAASQSGGATASPSRGPAATPPSGGLAASQSGGPATPPTGGATASPSGGPAATPPSGGPAASQSGGPATPPSGGATASPSGGPAATHPSGGPAASQSGGPATPPSGGATASQSGGPAATPPSGGPAASQSGGPAATPPSGSPAATPPSGGPPSTRPTSLPLSTRPSSGPAATQQTAGSATTRRGSQSSKKGRKKK